jgi:Mn-containing catalase
MFEAALDSIQPNFPPGVLAADPRFLQQAYNLSDGTVRGPWNEGEIKGMGKDFVYIDNPIAYVRETDGQTIQPKEMDKALAETEKLDKEMSKLKSEEVKKADPKGVAQWSTY